MCSSNPTRQDGFLTPAPGDYGPLGPLGGTAPTGFTPNGVPDQHCRRGDPDRRTDAGHRPPTGTRKPSSDTPGINGSTVPLPYGLDPARVPLAGSYVEGPAQQESKLASAWYQLSAPDAAHPLVVVLPLAETITGNSIVQRPHRRPDGPARIRTART